jgi:hypothetical protein
LADYADWHMSPARDTIGSRSTESFPGAQSFSDGR